MDKDTLDDARADFKLCVDAESENRKVALDDLEFALLSKQWPEDVKSQREKEGRPCLTINRLPAFIKQVTNDARQNRPSINVHPVGDGSDKEVARIYQDLIRNIETVSKADIAYDTGLDFAAYSGIGYWVVRDQYTCEDSFDKDLVIERVNNPFSIYGDPESQSATSADWNKAFIQNLYTEAAFKRKWKGADSTGFESGADESSQLWYEDKQIRVAEWWTREEVPVKLLKLSDGSIMYEDEYMKVDESGLSLKQIMDVQGIMVEGERETKTYKVKQRIITGKEVLEENEWQGKYIPIVPCYGNEFNINGRRFFRGLVTDAKDPARMFNYWRTASTELVALAPKTPFIGLVGQFATDNAKWQSANTASHAYIEADAVPGAQGLPQRQSFAGVPAGALQEALNASDDMKNIMGLHDASLGARSNETSGRAIMARQREGDVSTFNFADNRNRAIAHTGSILVDLIPKHYGVARILRCIKEDGSTYPMPVNQPAVPVQGQQMPGQPPQYQPASPQQQQDPQMAGVIKIFDLTTGKYDVTVTAGPSYTTRREESRESMMEFMRVVPQAAPMIGDLIAKAQDWPGADEIAERLKPPAVNPQVQQLQQQMQQVQQQAGQQIQQLTQENQQLKMANADKQAETALKSEELRLKGFTAETDRIKTIAEIENAEKDRNARVIESANNAIQAQNTGEQRPPM